MSLNKPGTEPGSSGEGISVDADYTATYSWAVRAIAIGMTLFSGTLVVFFLLRSARLPALMISVTMFAFTLVNLLHVTGTRVQFTKDGVVATKSWFRQVAGRYADIQCISSKPGTVKIEFSDGQSVKLHPGLGDPDKVIAYLQTRSPESVKLA
jgi:hypothetical protein